MTVARSSMPLIILRHRPARTTHQPCSLQENTRTPLRRFDFDSDERWQAYLCRATIPPGMEERARAKWYKREIVSRPSCLDARGLQGCSSTGGPLEKVQCG